MKINIPELSVVVLIGASGSGKSTFAKRHFLPTEVVSSDRCRGVVSDDELDQSATDDAFELLHTTMRLRLKRRKLVVVDATNVQPDARRPLLEIAKAYHALPVAIVLDVDEATCQARNASREDRQFGAHVVRNHQRQLKRTIKGLKREGFRHIYHLRGQEEIDAAQLERMPLWTNLTHERGPFDLIGDVHGCFDELRALLETLGYKVSHEPEQALPWAVEPPQGRKAVFLGDLVDRGPKTPDVLKLVMRMVQEDKARCVCGNHDAKLARALHGKKVQLKHGLAESMAQLELETPEFRRQACTFLDGLLSHYMLDGGALCVAHAGLKEELQGRASGVVRSFAMYGETTGEIDAFGLPVRHDWAAQYRGAATVVYGHTPTPEAVWMNKTLCVDTGCVFGGKLTALTYPELEIVSVQAAQVYSEPIKPLSAPERAHSALGLNDQSLRLEDVTGKLRLHAKLYDAHRTVIIDAAQAAAALETMSRFSADPRWLVYLPPTMSPTKTSQREGLLEHPEEALEYYRGVGVKEVIAQKKHMGSRALVMVTREDEVAITRFGFERGAPGAILTRTGRAFFGREDARGVEVALLARVRQAIEHAGLFDALETDWLLLDAELMPWSAKAQALLVDQYAAVGAAAVAATTGAQALLEMTAARGVNVGELAALQEQRAGAARGLIAAYRHYCWEVQSLDDYRIAPFHVLAGEGQVYLERDHRWQMSTLGALCEADPTPLLMPTAHKIVNLEDEAQVEALYAWWQTLVDGGDEGVVIKPMGAIVRGAKGIIQPALKCRGPEYLRLIYGPEYDMPANLERLRVRGVGKKRELALKEFALGYQALKNFVEREPLREVHRYTFGVLALESERVDPRL